MIIVNNSKHCYQFVKLLENIYNDVECGVIIDDNIVSLIVSLFLSKYYKDIVVRKYKFGE